MHSIRIPNTDLDVSSLCLGTGQFGSDLDQTASWRLLDEFLDAGGNFIDTANVYGDWVPGTKSSSEKMIGAWLAAGGQRERLVIATKGAHPLLSTMNVPRCAPQEIIHDIDQSLGHLQTGVIDLYWLHRDDPTRPTGEIIETLAAQVKAGKIRYFGCSNWQVDRIRTANAYAAAQGLPGFVADSMLWNVAALDAAALPDKTMVAMDPALYAYHQETGLAAIPYSSQAHGLLHKLAEGNSAAIRASHSAIYPLAANERRAAVAQALAQELGTSLTGVVLGYLQSQPFVTIPIIGARTLSHLHDSLAGDGVRLSAAQVAALDAAF
ncbi:MAG: aldo/keto reductase [Caldilineaceae bacterium]|nr:aldo/keto reductase [Caldilineaceae bacterium]